MTTVMERALLSADPASAGEIHIHLMLTDPEIMQLLILETEI